MNVHEITCSSYSLSLRDRGFKLLKLFRARSLIAKRGGFFLQHDRHICQRGIRSVYYELVS